MNIDQIKAAVKAAIEAPPVPLTVPLLGDIHIRQLTGADVEAQHATADKPHRSGRNAARLICDAKGQPAFDVNSEADCEFLSKLPVAVLAAITDKSNRNVSGEAAKND